MFILTKLYYEYVWRKEEKAVRDYVKHIKDIELGDFAGIGWMMHKYREIHEILDMMRECRCNHRTAISKMPYKRYNDLYDLMVDASVELIWKGVDAFAEDELVDALKEYHDERLAKQIEKSEKRRA